MSGEARLTQRGATAQCIKYKYLCYHDMSLWSLASIDNQCTSIHRNVPIYDRGYLLWINIDKQWTNLYNYDLSIYMCIIIFFIDNQCVSKYHNNISCYNT